VSLYERLLRPLLFRCDPEWVHHVTIRTGSGLGRLGPLRSVLDACCRVADPRLETEVCGLRFRNPIGLAAGYDKSGEAVALLECLGFGHIEVGSVSAEASDGNPKPRLFRLPLDEAIVVHYGLQNDGAEVVAERLRGARRRQPLGLNIVKTNKGIDAPPEDEESIIADYLCSVRLLRGCGDYLMLNLSCPNTEMGRDFFGEGDHLVHLLSALAGEELGCPLFLKLSPLGGSAYLEAVLSAAEGFDFVSGFAFNLAPGKTVPLRSPAELSEGMPGAVAGHPVRQMMNERIGELYRRMERKRYRIIGIGGVASAEDAYEKIRLGASLVQLLTGLVYGGPALVRRINRGLCRLLEADGFASVSRAVGSANR